MSAAITYRHGDMIRIIADNAVAVVDYQSWASGMIFIFDPLDNYASTAFFPDEVEPIKETENA